MKMIVVRSKKAFASPDIKGGFRASSRYPVGTDSQRTFRPQEEDAQFAVSVADYGSDKELAEARRDPHSIHIPPFPTMLIRPREKPGASDAPKVSWGLDAVKARSSPFTGAGINVAVLDTGIAQHPAFAGIEPVTKNFTDEADADLDGHGTHCAGTIFGRDVGGFRIGVARGVTNVFIGKVLAKNGGGTTDQLVEAINWAKDSGAHIISMSLGIDYAAYREFLEKKRGMPPEVATSMALAGYRANIRLFDLMSRQVVESEGVRTALLIAAAGNASRRELSHDFRITVEPPAAGDAFLSVAAVGPATDAGSNNYAVADFSNIGARLSAPGVGIWSASPDGGLAPMDGTSMAAPHVAGVAALWAERMLKRPPYKFNARRLRDEIEHSLLRLDHLDPEDIGYGLVQAPQT